MLGTFCLFSDRPEIQSLANNPLILLGEILPMISVMLITLVIYTIHIDEDWSYVKLLSKYIPSFRDLPSDMDVVRELDESVEKKLEKVKNKNERK
jgi:hypothetical protein